MKLTPKVILEGTRLVGKTDLAFALNEHPRLVGDRRYRYHSPLISAEWCGFTNEPWGRGLINFASSVGRGCRTPYRSDSSRYSSLKSARRSSIAVRAGC